MLRRLLRWLWPCRHRTGTRRERRTLHGQQVLHIVCACGYAKPAVPRTAEEHVQAIRQGQIKRHLWMLRRLGTRRGRIVWTLPLLASVAGCALKLWLVSWWASLRRASQ